MMDITEAVRKRESVRAYEDKPVPEPLLTKVVEAGRWAPNAGPFLITVIRNKGILKKINDSAFNAMLNSDNEFARKRVSLPGYQPLYGAPVLILLSGPVNAPFSAVNAALAAENMLLEATGLGLGTCYLVSPTLALNGDDNRNLAQEAGVPEGYAVQCGVIVGYAAAENKFALGNRAQKGRVDYID
jgi:FMN reductase [NAD(P)H]